jgi:hypothetical protein
MLARRNGRCKVCSGRIVAGEDYIARDEKRGWIHAGCAVNLRRAKEIFDAHQDDDNDSSEES